LGVRGIRSARFLDWCVLVDDMAVKETRPSTRSDTAVPHFAGKDHRRAHPLRG
jgi:hypothetical protein